MPPINVPNDENQTQEALLKAAEQDGDEPQGKPSIVYEQFKREAPSNDLLTEEEIANLSDGGETPDTYDDEAGQSDELNIDTPEGEAGDPAPDSTQTPSDKTDKTDKTPPPPDLPSFIDPNVDYQAALTKADTDLADLKTLYGDGEIGDDEYNEKLSALHEQRADLRAAVKVIQSVVEARSKADDAKWDAAIKDFKVSHPHLFAQEHFDNFNIDVAAITGDRRYNSQSFTKQLEKAARDYAERIGNPRVAQPLKAADAPKPAPKAPPKATRQPVPTLAKIPSSAAAPIDGSRYGALDSLLDAGNVMASEGALARMSKAELEAYGNAQ